MVGRCSAWGPGVSAPRVQGPRFSRPAFSGFDVPATGRGRRPFPQSRAETGDFSRHIAGLETFWAFTAAGGIIYKQGPIRFSLIDKYTGKEWFSANQPTDPMQFTSGYNSAIVSARYEIGPVRLGVEINNLFNSQRLINNSGGQLFYQTPRAYTGDITLTF